MGVLKTLFALAIVASVAARVAAQEVRAVVRDDKGQKVGELVLAQKANGVKVSFVGEKLPPGFHGFHIHAVGKCEPPFASAGGHWNPTGKDHPHHAGDLPNLLVNDDGSAFVALKTSRFRVADLLDADGSALIIHADPDNDAHIPPRYRPDPDAATLASGDAGARLACGVIAK